MMLADEFDSAASGSEASFSSSIGGGQPRSILKVKQPPLTRRSRHKPRSMSVPHVYGHAGQTILGRGSERLNDSCCSDYPDDSIVSEVESRDSIQKLKLAQQDSTQSNGSLSFGLLRDSGIDEMNHSGISVGVVPEALVAVVADFASAGSNMLASEPVSEVEPEIEPEGGPFLLNSPSPHRSGLPEGVGSSTEKLVAILNPYDKKVKELRTLKQHYYPEGGWGWVIVLVTVAVQILSHGLQFGLAIYVISLPKTSIIYRRMGMSLESSGKK